MMTPDRDAQDADPGDRSTAPAVIVAASGAAAEIIGVTMNPHSRSELVDVVALVGRGDLLADLADRMGVPLLSQLDEAPAGVCVAFAGAQLSLEDRTAAAMSARGHRAVTLVHADSTIGPWVTLGPGCVVSPGVRITANVTVGAFCQLHTGAIVSHDDVLGDHVTLSPGVTLCGGVTVGDRSTVFAGATVMPGVTIGTDAVVGAGAMVNRNVADGATVAGVPARELEKSEAGRP